MELFTENGYRLLTVNYFHKKVLSLMFDWVLNTTLPLKVLSFIGSLYSSNLDSRSDQWADHYQSAYLGILEEVVVVWINSNFFWNSSTFFPSSSIICFNVLHTSCHQHISVLLENL